VRFFPISARAGAKEGHGFDLRTLEIVDPGASQRVVFQVPRLPPIRSDDHDVSEVQAEVPLVEDGQKNGSEGAHERFAAAPPDHQPSLLGGVLRWLSPAREAPIDLELRHRHRQQCEDPLETDRSRRPGPQVLEDGERPEDLLVVDGLYDVYGLASGAWPPPSAAMA